MAGGNDFVIVAAPSTRVLIGAASNDYREIVGEYETRVGVSWWDVAPATVRATRSLSVVIPVRDVGYCLDAVLTGILRAWTAECRSVVVVDDGSTDNTFEVAIRHPLHATVVRLPHHMGRSIARNIGTALVDADTVMYVDGDMLISAGTLHEHSLRAHPGLIGIGFRHDISHNDLRLQRFRDGDTDLHAELQGDSRVTWRVGPCTLIHTGLVLDHEVVCSPLEETDQLRDLGFGATLYDWDLPRMVVTAMVSMPRQSVLDIGGFDADFASGWGLEDTHLGAKLIAAGLKVVPITTTVGFHVDPPDLAAQWPAKLATWPSNVAIYRKKVAEPFRQGLTNDFLRVASAILELSEVHRSSSF